MIMGIRTNILFSKCLFIFCLFIFQACGLDTFYSLEPPVNIIHKPLYNTADHTQMYFDFYTNSCDVELLEDVRACKDKSLFTYKKVLVQHYKGIIFSFS